MNDTLKVGTINREVLVRTADGTAIRGTVNLDGESERMDRISDLLIKGKSRFLVISNATVHGQKNRTVLVNKDQIVYVEDVEGIDTDR